MEQILQLDLTNYMIGGVALKAPANLNKPEKQVIWNIGKERCGLYEFQPHGRKTREQIYNTFITLYRTKLYVLHTKLAQKSHYRNFIKKMYENTLSISMYIIKYEHGDDLYQEIRQSLLTLFEAIDYLVNHDGVEHVTELITVDQFHKAIFHLKLLNLMKHIKQQKKLVDQFPYSVIQLIKATYLYNVIILGTAKNLSQRLEQANLDFKKYGVQFNVKLQDKMVLKQNALNCSWEALYGLRVPLFIKEWIFQDLKKGLSM